jgi:hypothetical protein
MGNVSPAGMVVGREQAAPLDIKRKREGSRKEKEKEKKEEKKGRTV